MKICNPKSEIRINSSPIPNCQSPIYLYARLGASQRSAVCEIHAFAPRVIFYLIAVDTADAEVGRLRMGEIVTADRCRRRHGETLRQGNARRLRRVQHAEQRFLLRVVGAGGIARARAGCRGNPRGSAPRCSTVPAECRPNIPRAPACACTRPAPRPGDRPGPWP